MSTKTTEPGRGNKPAMEPLDVQVSNVPPAAAFHHVSSLPPVGFGENSPLTLPAICGYGRFELLGRLAFGGMAEIFLAREPSTVGAARLIAIKRILPRVAGDPEFVKMFLDEARLAIQLKHPSICHLYEFGELEGTYFIAMEWIHGAQLGKVIRAARAHGGVPPVLAARIISQIAEALHYAHRLRDGSGEPLGIVHRDVSPHNIMVSFDGHVKLLDFGIAKAVSQQAKTEAGVVKGKFAYMAPEQCLGKPIDGRADVFALGVCLFEVLTGETLYVRPTDYETMHAVLQDPVPSARALRKEVPSELDAVLKMALAKDADSRFKSAGAMQTALDDWIAKRGVAVNARSLASLMAKLFADQIQAGPLVDSTPFGNSVLHRVPTPETPDPNRDAETRVGHGSAVQAPNWGSLSPPASPDAASNRSGSTATEGNVIEGNVIESLSPAGPAPAARPAGRPPAPAEARLEAELASLSPPGSPRAPLDAGSLDLAFDPRKPVTKKPPRPRVISERAPPSWRASFDALPAGLRWTAGLLVVVIALGVASMAYRAIVRAVVGDDVSVED